MVLFPALVQLGLLLVQGGGGLLVLGQPVLVLGQPLVVRRPGVGQVGLALPQLGQGVVQLALGVGGLPRQGVLPVVVVRPAVVQLPSAVLELLPGVGQLLFRIRPGVLEFIPGVVQLGLGVPDELVIPGLGPLLGQGVQAVHQLLEPVLVLVPVGVQAGQPLPGEVGAGVVLKGEILPRYVNKGVHRAAAQGGGPPVQGHIQGGIHHPRDGIDGVGQIPLAVLLQGELQLVPYLKAQLHQQQALGDALVRRLGQAALLHLQQVEPLRQGAHADDAVHGHRVQVPAALHRLNALRPGQGLQIPVGQPQGGQDVAVHQMGAVVVVVGGVLHVRRGGAQAGQEGHRQRRQHQNGQKAVHGAPDLPDGVGAQVVFVGYHSISSTGVGWALRSTAATRPLLMWITLSAMGVRAVL